jgi:peptidoglycan/LPS O-acetylase OafA/YrhL
VTAPRDSQLAAGPPFVSEGRRSTARARIASLDIVRGLAALSVFITHWNESTAQGASAGWPDALVRGPDSLIRLVWTGGGIHPGVIAFIVLSGFCIHLPLSRNPSASDAPGFWRAYARRRAWRIEPVYLLATLLGFAAAIVAARSPLVPLPVVPGHWNAFGVVATLLGVTALLQPCSRALFLHAGNEPLGTVTREMLLYATYPFFLWLRRRRGAGAVLALALVAYTAVVVLRARGVDPVRLHGSYLEFLLYWILGAAAAESLAEHPVRLGRESLLVAASWIACFAFSFVVQVKGAHVVRTLLFALSVAALLRLLVGWESAQTTPPGHLAGWFATIGERSYSLYAIHVPLLVFVLAGQHALGFDAQRGWGRWLSLPIIFAGTELVYRVVERPAHQLARSQRA